VQDVVTPVPSKPIGPRATAAWLSARGLYVPPTFNWEVTIAIDSGTTPAAQLVIAIDWLEWSFMFTHQNRMSWIRVMTAPEVHERDDFELLETTPALRNFSTLVRGLEDRFEIDLRRAAPAILTNIPNAENKIRMWANFQSTGW
jgi:hypothetical protein